MKIAVNAWFHNSLHTGSGQYTRHVVASLREIAPDVRIELVQPSSRGDVAKIAFEQIGFPRAARRMRADVAFVPYWAPPLSSPVPVVVTIHDVIPLALPAYRGGVRQRAYFSLVRGAAHAAAAVITDSEHSRRDIAAHVGVDEARVTAIPLAMDARFSPVVSAEDEARVRERYDLPESFVFYLGGFDARKNVETLLQVYVWCGETIGHEYPLVVSGRPDEVATTSAGARVALADMARQLEVDDCVKFIGRVDEQDKPAVYALSRAFLYPSAYEGFGLNPLEALACGVPVVGSNASSLPEVVGNAGMLVEPGDARRMAGALIATCTEDELHDRLSRLALLQAARFSWQRTAYETLAVLRRAVRGDIVAP